MWKLTNLLKVNLKVCTFGYLSNMPTELLLLIIKLVNFDQKCLCYWSRVLCQVTSDLTWPEPNPCYTNWCVISDQLHVIPNISFLSATATSMDTHQVPSPRVSLDQRLWFCFSGLGQPEEGCSKSVVNSCADCIKAGPYCLWCQDLVRNRPHSCVVTMTGPHREKINTYRLS